MSELYKQDDDKMMWVTGNTFIMGQEKFLNDESELMVAVEKSDPDASLVTVEWMNENEELGESWIPEGEEEMASVNLKPYLIKKVPDFP